MIMKDEEIYNIKLRDYSAENDTRREVKEITILSAPPFIKKYKNNKTTKGE